LFLFALALASATSPATPQNGALAMIASRINAAHPHDGSFRFTEADVIGNVLTLGISTDQPQPLTADDEGERTVRAMICATAPMRAVMDRQLAIIRIVYSAPNWPTALKVDVRGSDCGATIAPAPAITSAPAPAATEEALKVDPALARAKPLIQELLAYAVLAGMCQEHLKQSDIAYFDHFEAEIGGPVSVWMADARRKGQAEPEASAKYCTGAIAQTAHAVDAAYDVLSGHRVSK
jgi:hypothetical protein